MASTCIDEHPASTSGPENGPGTRELWPRRAMRATAPLSLAAFSRRRLLWSILRTNDATLLDISVPERVVFRRNPGRTWPNGAETNPSVSVPKFRTVSAHVGQVSPKSKFGRFVSHLSRLVRARPHSAPVQPTCVKRQRELALRADAFALLEARSCRGGRELDGWLPGG